MRACRLDGTTSEQIDYVRLTSPLHRLNGDHMIRRHAIHTAIGDDKVVNSAVCISDKPRSPPRYTARSGTGAIEHDRHRRSSLRHPCHVEDSVGNTNGRVVRDAHGVYRDMRQ